MKIVTRGTPTKIPFEQINSGNIGWSCTPSEWSEYISACGWTMEDYLKERDYRMVFNLAPFNTGPLRTMLITVDHVDTPDALVVKAALQLGRLTWRQIAALIPGVTP